MVATIIVIGSAGWECNHPACQHQPSQSQLCGHVGECGLHGQDGAIAAPRVIDQLLYQA
jgi:hypothetical protein